jgi:hypothetical protein
MAHIVTPARVGAILHAAWEEMAPAVSYQYDECGMERWDGKGEGPSRCLAFEGFGLSFSLFFGRMPRKAVR